MYSRRTTEQNRAWIYGCYAFDECKTLWAFTMERTLHNVN